jgi:hypothetical protein
VKAGRANRFTIARRHPVLFRNRRLELLRRRFQGLQVGEQWGGGWALTPPCICPRKWTRHVHVSARCIGTAVKFALSAFAHHATVHSLQLPQPCQAIRPSPTPGAHSYRLLAAIEPPRLSGCGALRARSYGQLVGSQSTHSPVSIEGRVLSDISAPKSLVALWK